MYADIEIYKSDDDVYIACCPELNLYVNADTQGKATAKLRKKIGDFIDRHDLSFEASKDIDSTVKYYSARSPQTH